MLSLTQHISDSLATTVTVTRDDAFVAITAPDRADVLDHELMQMVRFSIRDTGYICRPEQDGKPLDLRNNRRGGPTTMLRLGVTHSYHASMLLGEADIRALALLDFRDLTALMHASVKIYRRLSPPVKAILSLDEVWQSADKEVRILMNAQLLQRARPK